MPDVSTIQRRPDLELAVSLARLGLGVNIALHGWTRVFKFAEFTSYLDQQFAHSVLPHAVVGASAYAIVGAESSIGLLLLAGLALRAALAAGCWLMIALMFGTCLIQNWSAASEQLIYLGFYAALLAFRDWDRWSLDARLRRRGEGSSGGASGA